MALEKFADTPNQGITTLDGALSDSATTIPVDSMADLKLTGLTGTDFAYCKITKIVNWRQHPINRKESFEIVKVTAVSSNDLTAVRGADSTNGTTFESGDIVEVVFVSIHYQHLVDALTDGTKELNIGALTVAGLVTASDISESHRIGDLYIGKLPGIVASIQGIKHTSVAGTLAFALTQNSSGQAALNTAEGQVLNISQNNVVKLRIDAGGDLVALTDLVHSGGDLYWVGAGTGIPFGFMYVDGAQTIIVALTVNTPAEVKDDGTTSADDGWLAGELNLFTMAAADLHYFSPALAGKYEIVWDLSFNMASPGANVEIHGGIAIDGTPITDKGAAHRTIANNTDTGNMCGLAILDLAADAQISLWLENTTNSADVTVHHGNVTIKMVGG